MIHLNTLFPGELPLAFGRAVGYRILLDTFGYFWQLALAVQLCVQRCSAWTVARKLSKRRASLMLWPRSRWNGFQREREGMAMKSLKWIGGDREDWEHVRSSHKKSAQDTAIVTFQEWLLNFLWRGEWWCHTVLVWTACEQRRISGWKRHLPKGEYIMLQADQCVYIYIFISSVRLCIYTLLYI